MPLKFLFWINSCMKVREILIETPPIFGASYFNSPFDREKVNEIIRWFRNHVDTSKFDLMVGTGASGSSIVPILAYIFKKRFAIVRKPSDSSHEGRVVAGNIEDKDRWIFIDDFIESGRTLQRVKSSINNEITKRPYGVKPRYVGAFLYNDFDLSPKLEKKISARKPAKARVRKTTTKDYSK